MGLFNVDKKVIGLGKKLNRQLSWPMRNVSVAYAHALCMAFNGRHMIFPANKYRDFHLHIEGLDAICGFYDFK